MANFRPRHHAQHGARHRATPVSAIERGLKTRMLSLMMLILASSLGLWFVNFEPWAIFAWLIIAFAGGYAIFEFALFFSKSLVMLSSLVMQFFVLDGVPRLLEFGSPTNAMMITFALLDIILLYALSKL